MKRPVLESWRYNKEILCAMFGFLLSSYGEQTVVQRALAPERNQERSIMGPRTVNVHDKQNKAVGQYYFAVTNGLAAIEEIIESQSLLNAVNMRTLKFSNNASWQAYTSKWAFDTKQHVEDLIGVFNMHEDSCEQLKDEVDLLRVIVSSKVLTLETYLSGTRRTREEWINVLNREGVMELLAMEAHCKAELYRQVEANIRAMQNSDQGGVVP
jgi:hypothetical protein